MFSSSFQRLTPSRETHQSSNVPISVTRDSKRTGKTVPCWPSSLSVTSSGLSSSISLPQFSRRSPTRSCFRIVELRKRNSAGSPTTNANSLSVPGPSVIGRPSRHCMLEVRRFQNIGRTKRFKSLFGQPAIEHLYQPPPQHVRLHDAPIEQNMRRACQTVSPSPNVASFRTVLYLMGQKARQVLRDCRISGIRQA